MGLANQRLIAAIFQERYRATTCSKMKGDPRELKGGCQAVAVTRLFMRKVICLFCLFLVTPAWAALSVQEAVELFLFEGEKAALARLQQEGPGSGWSEQTAAARSPQELERLRALTYLQLAGQAWGRQPPPGGQAASQQFRQKVEHYEKLVEELAQLAEQGQMAALQQRIRPVAQELHQWVTWTRPQAQGPRHERLEIVYAMTFIANVQPGQALPAMSTLPDQSDLVAGLPFEGPCSPAEAASGLGDNPDWRLADYLARIGAYELALEHLNKVHHPLARLRGSILESELGRPMKAQAGLEPAEELYHLLALMRQAEERGQLQQFGRLAQQGLKSAATPWHRFCFLSAAYRYQKATGPLPEPAELETAFHQALGHLEKVSPDQPTFPLVKTWASQDLADWRRDWLESATELPTFSTTLQRLDLALLPLLAGGEMLPDWWIHEQQEQTFVANHEMVVQMLTKPVTTRFASLAGLYWVNRAQALEGQQARAALDRALELLIQGCDREALARARLLKAELLFRLRPDSWEAGASRLASEVIQESFDLELRSRARVILALAFRQTNRHAEAKEELTLARQEVEKYVMEAGGGAATKARLEAKLSLLFELLTLVSLEENQPQSALGVLEQQTMLTHLAACQPIETAALRWKQNQIAALRRQLSSEPGAVARLEQARQELSQMFAELRLDPRYQKLLATSPSEFESLQATLPTDTLLLQPFVPAEIGDPTVYLLVATRQTLAVVTVPVKGADLHNEVRRFRRLLESGRTGSGRELLASLEKLGGWLIAPLGDRLQGVKTLAVVPSGPLNYLPFSALRVNGRYLIEDRQVVTLIRSGDLTRLSEAAASVEGSWSFYANPDGTLPGAELESRAIASRHPQSQLLVGSKATEQHLTRSAGSSRVLHLATHGKVVSHNPDFSYLVMANSQRLTRREILSQFRLPTTRLVTLSACETALSGRTSGVEVNSLADAFWVAGARAVIGSLWSVPDRATSLLMVSFYERLLAGQSPGKALRQAQLRLLSQPATAHPKNWSGFILWGDWR